MKRIWPLIVGILCAVLVLCGAGFLTFARADTLVVNADESIGTMKPLHGINNGPKSRYTQAPDGSVQWELDATELYQELEIPFVRTHDSEFPYGSGQFIDIHCVFPDFSRDPDDPDAYQFEQTDQYLAAIQDSGAQVFYRLGESIDPLGENQYTNPPKDYETWAQVCEHIIRHYNDGWADGYEYGIVYWEIWNEPDVQRQWSGNLEEYYELYRTTARYLKKLHPDIRVGGGSMGNCSEETVSGFLESLTADGSETPLDFYSWHTYANDPNRFAKRSVMIRTLLDQYGLEETESILTEWNYIQDWEDLEGNAEFLRSPAYAVFLGASLIALQNSPVDAAMYYDGQFTSGDTDVWCGLYDDQGEPLPGFSAFDFYHQLCQLGQQVETGTVPHDLAICAASDGDTTGVLIACDSSTSLRLKLEGCDAKNYTVTRVNADAPNGAASSGRLFFDSVTLDLEPGDLLYVELS